jgi:hypothetical protein
MVLAPAAAEFAAAIRPASPPPMTTTSAFVDDVRWCIAIAPIKSCCTREGIVTIPCHSNVEDDCEPLRFHPGVGLVSIEVLRPRSAIARVAV